MSYQAISLSGLGYASRADAICMGLNIGLSDFMLEGWVKLNVPIASQTNYSRIWDKKGADGKGYYFLLFHTGNRIAINLDDDVTQVETYISGTILNDLKWHYVVVTADRSSATGLNIFVGGVLQTPTSQDNLTAVGNIDTTGRFTVGANRNAAYGIDALFDEWRVWNFGYAGLPGDYATYITWRSQGRHRFLSLSEYNGGSWNGYADALQTELITLGDLDDDNGDFEGAGADGTDIEVGTDWGKNNVSAEVDNEAGSGVNSYNGSTFCAKVHTATLGSARMQLGGANFEAAFVNGEWYEISFDYKVANVTDAFMYMYDGSGQIAAFSLISVSWTTGKVVFQMTDTSGAILRCYIHAEAVGQTGNEVVWVDNISIKRIGNVAHWKFENNLLDEVGQNDLTAGGVGNLYPTYSLKREKIILAGAVNPAMGDRR